MTRLCVCLVLLVLPCSALANESSDPISELAQAHARAALALKHSPRAGAYLIRLHGLRDELEDLTLLSRTYEAFLDDEGVSPQVRDLARILMLDTEKARGRLPKALALGRDLGQLHEFYVVGGFDNEGKSGCKKDFGPESRLDLGASYPGKTHDVRWHKLNALTYDGYMDLSGSIRPNRETVAYALTFLDAPQDAQTLLGLGTSGAYRLWVNGQLVSSEDRYNVPRPDQSRVAVRLRKGLNPVLLKVCQQSGPLGFYLRADGKAKQVLPSVLPPLEKRPNANPRRLANLPDSMASLVKSHPADSTLRGEYATVLKFFRTFDQTDNVASEEAERAADGAPKDASLQLLAANLEEDDLNLRRKYLQAALQADPENPMVHLALAQFELSRSHPDRTLGLLSSTLKGHPDFGAASLTLATAYQELGEPAKAAELVEQTLAAHPSLPLAAREGARMARRLDRPKVALERLRLALALRFDDLGQRRALAEILADLSRIDEAGFEWSQILKLSPYDNSSRIRLAELWAANGRQADSDALFTQAMDMAPDDPEVYERYGRTLLQTGRKVQAVAAFEHSLSLRPQNPALREALRALKGDNTAPAIQYAFDVKALEKEANAFADEDAVYLVDYNYTRVQPSGLSSRFQQLAVKVYNSRGVDAFRSFPITYSPDRQEIQILRARITKADGTVVESYGETDKNLNEPWSAMYYDAHAKVLSFPALAPGDILELQYRLEDTAQENLLSDYWGDVDYVQATSPKVRYQYIVDMPKARPLYWNKSHNISGLKFQRQESNDGRVLYRWNAERVRKVVPEPSMPGWAEVASTLHVSTYETWDQVGRYYWSLVQDQLTPNLELRNTVNRVLSGVDRNDQLAVIRAIYDFVVTHTRYVALEFGIHGYKPYRVDQILSRRFGDCKDKASLIHAMLKVAGVDSELVLLRMRHLGNIGQEPASLAAFNHAIAYVPKFNLFLDGTADFHNTRELPSADHLANVLVVGANGTSKFFTTPEAKAADNLTQLNLDVFLKPDGSADAKGDSTVTGEAAPEYRRAYQASATRKATFEQGWAQTFPGLKVTDVAFSHGNDLDADVSMTYAMQVPRYAEAPPNTLRFYPFGGDRSYTQTLAPLSERRLDLVLPSPWTHRFSFRYHLPPGYGATTLPPPVNEESPFGHLRLDFRREADGTLVCDGEMTLETTRIKAADYPRFRLFLNRVDQAFSRKIVASGPLGPTARNE